MGRDQSAQISTTEFAAWELREDIQLRKTMFSVEVLRPYRYRTGGYITLVDCFKGGTCLKKCYIETYRFSEDLQFYSA